MNTSDILQMRLHNQLLATHNLKKPHEVVAWMGAMQSQSLELAKWAIGSRLQGSIVQDVEKALNTGTIIRTHILRPTWHFVSSEDIYWMFELSNPRLKPIYQSYARMQGVDEAFIYKAMPGLVKVLEGNKHLTKQEITEGLVLHDIVIDDIDVLNRVIQYAEMEGLIVNGCIKGKQQTFTLLEEFVPRKEAISKEETLERLARKFFTSHAPATIQDFAWWSGLSMTECKQSLESIKHDFVCEKINGRDFWMKNDIKIPPGNKVSALLLSPFDEFVVSYKERSEMIEEVHYSKVMTKNGLFSPTVMLNGEIVGSWKKMSVKGSPKVELSFFKEKTEKIQALFSSEVKKVQRFFYQKQD